MLSRRQFVAGLCSLALLKVRIPLEEERSRAVLVRGLESGGSRDHLEVFRRALDLGISKLLDKKPADAWTSILSAGVPVSIKVDAISPLSSTSNTLVIALVEQLFDQLIHPWDITIWDRRASDIQSHSFQLRTRRGRLEVRASEENNYAGPNARGYVAEARYSPSWLLTSNGDSCFTRLLSPTPGTLINLPAAKHHPSVGIDGALLSLALRSVNNSERFYLSPEVLARATAEIWRLEPLRGYVLTIMDASAVIYHGGPVGLPAYTAKEDALIISTDPVAVDAVALDLIDKRRLAAGLSSCKTDGLLLLKKAEELGIGSAEPQVVEVTVPFL